MRKLKTVIHVHTDYSLDSNSSPAQLVETARRRQVDCVAITDHDAIAGAQEAARISADLGPLGPRIVVGEEVSSRHGHIIGLFLTERVRPGLSAEGTARAIRAQGGLVLAPHPFLMFCRHSLGRLGMLRLLPYVDAVEVCNAQSIFPLSDRRAARFAARHRLPTYTGADAHLRGHLDACYQYIPEFTGPEDFMAALRMAQLVRGRFGPRYLAEMSHFHSVHKLSGRVRNGFGGNARATH